MSQNRPTYVAEVDEDTSFYLARIRQIDKILEGPAKTLIALAKDGKDRGKPSPAKSSLYFPTWIAPELEPKKEDNRLTQALCCGTLQRVRRFRRRFSWLDKSSEEQLEEVKKDLVDCFTPQQSQSFQDCAKLLNSETFGGLNPLTASQVFLILLNEGEESAHSGIGFLAFFAMIWPLSRSFPNRLTIGARIEPWEVTAYVTAKCLLPIRKLQGIIERRAKLYDDIAKNLTTLEKKKDESNPRDRWLFKIELDDLRANLSQLARLAINEQAFKECAKSIKEFSAGNDSEQIYGNVLESFSKALKAIKKTSEAVLKDAKEIVRCTRTMIAEPLRAKYREFKDPKEINGHDTERMTQPVLADQQPLSPAAESSLFGHLVDPEGLNVKFAHEYAQNSEYWEDLAAAAEKSIGYCEAALTELEAACKICPEAGPGIKSALADLANANRNVKDVLNKPVQDAALWCRSVVDREIAHASAENFTDFDPSELVSAIAVAVGWNLMTTPLQVSDAVTKAIAGARKDGSWRSGKPFYSPNHAFGVWALTSDIVWTLASALEHFPGVREADRELFNFVNWLERTQVSLTAISPAQKDGSWTEQKSAESSAPAQRPSLDYVGWAAERLRDRGKINLVTTALAINALLEVRDLAEYRLWELCKERFAVLDIDKPLREIDPVDLGAAHGQRLHRQLAEMAYRAGTNHDSAKYSLVLHGPPGSSKTKLAEALSSEMWKFSNRWGPRETRLIRITPADFTRMGEDRLDSEARAIFDLISGVRAVTVFFDEIDDLLRQRNTGGERPRFMDLVVPAMLNRLADLRGACPRQEISFILATNYVENIDSALIRKGRIDASIPVVYPDFESRVAIAIGEIERTLNKHAWKEQDKDKRLKIETFFKTPECRQEVARKTAEWPYLALTSLCAFLSKRVASESDSKSATDYKLLFEQALNDGVAIYGSSFSNPDYQQRWQHLQRFSQELLNEYWQHLISQPEQPDDCLALFKKQRTRKRLIELSKTSVPLSNDKLNTMFTTFLRKEGRQANRITYLTIGTAA